MADFECNKDKSVENAQQHSVLFLTRDVLTVRFIFRGNPIRIVAQDSDATGNPMNKNVDRKNKPIDDVEIVDDLLPSPEELSFKGETMKLQ